MKELGLKLTELLEQGIDLATAELPIFVEQLLTYKTVELLFWLLFSMIVVFGLTRKISKVWKKYDDPVDEIPVIIWTIFGGCGITSFTIVFLSNISEFIKITLAPRIWLLEYAADLIK